MLLKNRQSVSVQQTITNVLMYSKLVNIVLFYRLSPMAGFAYAAACFSKLKLVCYYKVFDCAVKMSFISQSDYGCFRKTLWMGQKK